MLRPFKTYYLLFIILLSACFETQEEAQIPPSFDLNGINTLSFQNQSTDTVQLEFENWYVLPSDGQIIDTLVPPSASISIDVIAQGGNTFEASANDIDFELFVRPGVADEIRYFKDSVGKVEFSGYNHRINDYLLRKRDHFGSTDAEWLPRALASHRMKDLGEFFDLNDKITQEHLTFLNTNKDELPEWYPIWEAKRLDYLNRSFKINNTFYRKKMMGKDDQFPDSLRNEILNEWNGSVPELLGNFRYYFFLIDYIGFLRDPDMVSDKPLTKQGWQEGFLERQSFSHNFDPLVRDVYTACSITGYYNSRKYVVDTAWFSLIENEAIRKRARSLFYEAGDDLQGSTVPYFKVSDLEGNKFSPQDFEGKVLLINFWATWCRPCIKEFPVENALVDQFAEDQVQVINVCVESQEEVWRIFNDKHEIKPLSLFADSAWTEVLNQNYQINSLPHHVLVDQNGMVVANKCRRPGEGVEEEIQKLLD